MEAFDFSVGSFGDQRLEKVGRDFHEALVERASPRIRRLARGRAQEVQFHRMLRNSKVDAAEMAASAGARTGLRARGRDIALIQDTSAIAVGGTKLGKKGFGPVGKGGAVRGILAHAAIAVDIKKGALLGLVDAQVWTRSGGKVVDDRKRPFEEKESYRWLRTCKIAQERLAEAGSITMVADAECDIFELFAGLPEGMDVVVRAAYDRKLETGGMLYETVARLPVRKKIKRVIPACPGRKKRLAKLELRWSKVRLNAPEGLPKGTPASLGLTVLDVREVDAPEGVEPVHWLLLTSHAIGNARRAVEVLDIYCGRFFIEQLFRTLKSAGFDIEECAIENPKALMTFAGFAIIASVTVMQLVKARDGGSGQTHADCFDPADKPLLAALSRRLEGKTPRQKNPHHPDDLAFASWVIARLGGWTIYYGKAGPAVMRHGLDRFYAIKLGAEIVKDLQIR